MSGVRRSLSAKTGFVGAMSGMGGARDRDIVIFLPHLDAPRRKAARGPRRDPRGRGGDSRPDANADTTPA